MLDIKNLYHSYGKDDNYAVENLSFEVEKGEIFGFLGPSGAGKSTTQNILIGLLELQKGTVKIDGKDLKSSGKKRFNTIGVSFEQPNVYKKLTGLENLAFYKKMYGVETEDPMTLLKMVGLEAAAHKRAAEYSKGMLQRLVFARSMMNNPKMWFLDEPTSGLDPGTASQIKKIIQEKNENGTTIFLTTHNMAIAESLCHRVGFINEGKVEVIDSPRNLKLKYGEQMVAVEYREKGILIHKRLSLKNEADIAVLNRLLEQGNIETIHSQEATLEQIFIQVTGRGLI